MKIPYPIFLLLFFIGGSLAIQAQIVSIPDANFKAALLSNTSINSNADTEIQVSEAQSFTGAIDVYNKSISDLTGIEAFTSLTILSCGLNQLTSLDLSNNTALSMLGCQYNQLTSLDLSNNANLTLLNCYYNQLTTLNLSSNTNLAYLYCNNNLLTSITFAVNSTLNIIHCNNNQLATIDVSNNNALYYLKCHDNLLTSIIPNSNLTELNCNDNQLTTLDLSLFPSLIELYCIRNQITNLDLSNSPFISKLHCYNNSLTSLNASMLTNLEELLCDYNQLIDLNIKNGNYLNLNTFSTLINPNLVCIEVDDPSYFNSQWSSSIDASASYSSSCLSSIHTTSELSNMNLFPNPTLGLFTINLGTTYNNINVEIRNSANQLIYTQNHTSKQQFDIQLDAAAGIYFATIKTDKGVLNARFIKL